MVALNWVDEWEVGQLVNVPTIYLTLPKGARLGRAETSCSQAVEWRARGELCDKWCISTHSVAFHCSLGLRIRGCFGGPASFVSAKQ